MRAKAQSRWAQFVASSAASTSRRAFVAWFLVAVVATFWIWNKAVLTSTLGEGDWPRSPAFSSYLKKAVVEIGEIPGWTRRHTSGWASHLQTYTALPETPLLSPFLPALLFIPAPWNTKIYIALHLVLGIAGIFFLFRQLRLRPLGAVISSLALFSSGHLTAHLAVGHVTWMMTAYFPWAVSFALRTFQRVTPLGIPRSPDALLSLGLTALSLALIIASGASHISVYGNVLVATVILGIGFREKRIAAALVLNLLIAFAVFLFGAARLIPTMVEYAKYVTPHRDPVYSFTVAELLTNFLVNSPERGWNWERGTYMGALTLVLAAVAVIFRRRKPIIAGLLLAILVGHTISALPPWDWLYKLPLLKTQGVHARFILLSVVAIALLAGFAVSALVSVGVRRRRGALVGALAAAIALGVILDLRANTEGWFKNFRNPHVASPPVVLDAPYVAAPAHRPAGVTAKSTRAFHVAIAPGPATTLVFPELGGETEAASWTTEGGGTIRPGVRPLTIDVGDNVTSFTLRVTPTKFFMGVWISLTSFFAWLAAVIVWRRRRRLQETGAGGRLDGTS